MAPLGYTMYSAYCIVQSPICWKIPCNIFSVLFYEYAYQSPFTNLRRGSVTNLYRNRASNYQSPLTTGINLILLTICQSPTRSRHQSLPKPGIQLPIICHHWDRSSNYQSPSHHWVQSPMTNNYWDQSLITNSTEINHRSPITTGTNQPLGPSLGPCFTHLHSSGSF